MFITSLSYDVYLQEYRRYYIIFWKVFSGYITLDLYGTDACPKSELYNMWSNVPM